MEPLTADEAQFAADHHSLVFHYLGMHHMTPTEFYDVAALGYLRAVKKWFARPDLRGKYKFTTIAWSCMWSDTGNFRKSARLRARHEAFSLDSPIPGAENLTFGDAIPWTGLSVEDAVCFRETLAEAYRPRGGRCFSEPKILRIWS